ncbi:hypothetical protein INT44_005382 [Umbelopsis vinacea]|uniref:F-box domain-containing protein n=1 Tax=Umbelopsis vinacea TaxID=44442 RepID=A0A8H7Q7Z0_9FUNG|nr:hypothetical protein INT44_005382 [Umbelopsis vinacea]
MENLARQPRRLDRVAFREIASPTVTISLRKKDGETHRWNTYNCSACLRPVYHPEFDWLKRVIVWKHCPAFGHGLESLYTGTFRTATQFEADDQTVTEARGPKISPFKILMHLHCFEQLIKNLANEPKTLELATYLQGLLFQTVDLTRESTAKKAMATKLGLMLKDRAENLQCLRIDEYELNDPYKIPQYVREGSSRTDMIHYGSCGQLSRLPAEILDCVMDFLSPLDFMNIRSTCTRLRHFPSPTRCWRRMLASRYPNFEWDGIKDWKYVYEHRLDEEMRNVSRALNQVDQICKWIGRS